MIRKQIVTVCMLSFIINACQPDSATNEMIEDVSNDNKELAEFLPLTTLDTKLLSSLPDNWAMVSSVQSDMATERDLKVTGEGNILVNKETGENLEIALDHGDIELEIDFMVPKGSNSGIYFQGRYEVQILDSWKKDQITTADLGSIYSDYDEETKTESNGSVASVNAAKAPGLWQNFKVLFRAPRFDEAGNKVSNAKFDYVYLNGHKIQENVEAPKPTRAAMFSDESELGPLMIQGDHGPVAFKNLKYKKIGSDTLSISNLKYKLYTADRFNAIPDFENLTPKSEGSADNLDDLQKLSGLRDHFAFVFEGELNVPKTGDYLLSTVYDDGGDVSIDGELVLHNGPKEYENQPSRAIVNLTEGVHALKMTYYQEVWGSYIMFQAEGPEIARHTVGCVDIFKKWRGGRKENVYLVDPTGEPEILRGYVNYGDEKRTHALSVGDPSGVNYSYDLMEGSLLKVWRGGFADVANMWVGRGHSQLLLPQNAATTLQASIPIASLSSSTTGWPSFRSDKYKNKGYSITDSGHPAFKFDFDKMKITDSFSPSPAGNLNRSVKINGTGKNHYYKIASGEQIIKMDNELYSIAGEYYINAEDDSNWSLRDGKGGQELIVPVQDGSNINYEIIW